MFVFFWGGEGNGEMDVRFFKQKLPLFKQNLPQKASINFIKLKQPTHPRPL